MVAIPEDEFDGRITAAKQSGRVSRAAVLRDEDVEEQQRARQEFDAFVASVTPPGRPSSSRLATTSARAQRLAGGGTRGTSHGRMPACWE